MFASRQKSPRSSMLYKRESWMDKVLRMRGLSILVTAPLVIAALYILLFPRDALTSLGSTRPGYAGEEVYAVVFDAGSTGSRVHVLKFEKTSSGLKLLKDTFQSLKPGLGDSGWKDEPERAAASLQPLLEEAIQAVPEEQQARTPVELRATAGLRLLGETQSKRILEAVTKVLENSPFMLVPNGVSVMDGIDEGAFAWLTLNYLLGKTGKPATELVGAIDLGGGSVQQAFAVNDATAKSAPEGYIRTMSGGGVTYNVYVWSYLGYGLMQGRGAVLGTSGSGSCINAGSTGSFKSPYGDGGDIPLESSPTGGDAQECQKAVVDAMHVGKDCDAAAKLCTFDGRWGAVESHKGRSFYVSSYFFDKALAAGIVCESCTDQAVVTPAEFMSTASKACKLPASEVQKIFPESSEDDAKFLCLDLSFQGTLLTEGMKIPEDQSITLVRKVQYNGEYYEAAWPLGAAIHTLHSLPEV